MTTRKKKAKEPLKDDHGWWLAGPFVSIASTTKGDNEYHSPSEPRSKLYGLDRDGQVWSLDAREHRWVKVSHVRADSPHPPPPPQSPQQNRRDVEHVRAVCGDAAADDLETKMRQNGKEIAAR